MIKNIVRKIRVLLKDDFSIEKELARFIKKNKDVFFIQVGSNNGVSNDPLRTHIINNKLRGILIEPVKYIYEELYKNYNKQPGLIFENIAIAEFDGFKNFYHLKKMEGRDLPVWYDQLGSFLPEVILKHKNEIPDIEDLMISEKVECLTFGSLLKKHAIKKVDIIHIDTEGFDYEIIKLINFSNLRPSLIIYEHKHLSDQDKLACETYLKSYDYTLFNEGNDTLAKQ